MRYKVLWIDDDYKIQSDFIGEAEQEGIDIEAVESHEEGMDLLYKQLDYFHAVILDAKVKKEKNSTTPDLNGLRASRDRLIEINKNGYLPFFIFTGQPDYAREGWFKESYGKYYIKAEDNEQLFKDLKIAIEKKEEYQIQKKYKSVFDVCSENYIGENASKYLMDILLNLENDDEKFDDEKYFNGIRKVIELVFKASNKLGLLHDKCIPNGIVNLTWASLFMAGKKFELKPSTEKIGSSKIHFPELLAKNVKYILDLSNAASHSESEEIKSGKVNFSEYKKGINSNYLLYSITYQIMDLLLWFKKYADDNPDSEKNIAQWQSSINQTEPEEWTKGEIIRIAKNDYGTLQPFDGGIEICIIPKLIKEHNLKLNQRIEVKLKPNNGSNKPFIEKIKT